MKKNDSSGDPATGLHRNYLEALRRRMTELRIFAARCHEGRVTAAEFEEVHMRVRSLVGSGAVYGHAGVGAAAVPFDQALADPTTAGLKTLAALAGDLAAACGQALNAPPAPEPAQIIAFPKMPAEPCASYPVLLTVDDDPAIHDLVRTICSENAYVVAAYSGVEALGAIRRYCPDLVLLDSYMPDMDGLQLLETMSDDRSLSSMPVIMLTADNRPHEVMRAAAAGAADYIAKPFDPRLLGEKIAGFLKRMRTTVLVASGNAMMRDLVAGKLRRLGFNAIEAEDGAQALTLARAHNPELIVLDQSLPGMDGRAVLHALRDDKRTRHIPTLYLSVDSLGQSVLEGLNTGTVDQAVMPFVPEKVTARILTALEPEMSCL